MFYLVDDTAPRPPWNKGKLIGQKKALKLKEIWTIRVRLQMAGDVRGLAMFNLAIDSKLRACDLVKLRVTDVTHGSVVMRRATVMQQKTHQRVQFEITEDTREAVSNWIEKARGCERLTTCSLAEFSGSPHISTQAVARSCRSPVNDLK
jgi:site-specific recombinase XerC